MSIISKTRLATSLCLSKNNTEKTKNEKIVCLSKNNTEKK